MPIHPFFKQQFPIVQVERGMRGQKEFITVVHPIDGLLRLPIAWTDRMPSKLAPLKNGEELLVTIKELLKLAAVCSAINNKELDICLSKQRLMKHSHNRSGAMGEGGKAKTAHRKRATKCASRHSSHNGSQNNGKEAKRGEHR